MPSLAYADDEVQVTYSHAEDLISLFNPFYWDYEYDTVDIKTSNTNIRMSAEDFQQKLSEDEIVFDDGISTVKYDKELLSEASDEALDSYSPDGYYIKKVILNGLITTIVLGSTILSISSERKNKQKKL